MALSQEFVLLDKAKHDRQSFDCGKDPVNEFLYTRAAKHQSQLSRTWVLPKKGPIPHSIAAYFTLASCTIKRDDLSTMEGLPPTQIPVVLLAQLGVDKDFVGQGLGEKTLITAIQYSIITTDRGLPAQAIILDALDDDALAFYNHFDVFKPTPGNDMRLYLPMRVAREICADLG